MGLLIERSLEWSKTVMVCQVALAWAYDSVTHEAVLGCMHRRGVLDVASAAYLCEMRSAESFLFKLCLWRAQRIAPGVGQRPGCPMSLMLFR